MGRSSAASEEVSMKRVIICILAVTVFAAPCIYDVFSSEPSPLLGLLAAASATPGFL
jgi:hypothetical protein